MNRSNNSGTFLLEALISLSIIMMYSSVIQFSLLTFTKSSIGLLQTHHSLQETLFIHDILEDDTLSPITITSVGKDTLTFIRNDEININLSLNSGRIGRSESGKRRTYLNDTHRIYSFESHIKENVLTFTLFFSNGNEQKFDYSIL